MVLEKDLSRKDFAMRGVYNSVTDIRRKVFAAIAKMAFEDDDKDKLASYSGILFDQAMLLEGLPIDDPLAFSKAVTELMK